MKRNRVRLEQEELDRLYWQSPAGREIERLMEPNAPDRRYRYSDRELLKGIRQWEPSKAEVALEKLRNNISGRIVAAECMGYSTEKLMEIFMGLTASIGLARKIQGII
jgi:GGDEF domain-containing protein